MGWDGSGNVTRNDGTNQQANNCELQSLSGDKRINPVKMDAEFNNLVDAIEATLHRGGQNAMIANLPMGGNRITGLGNGTDSGDAVNKGQLDTKLNLTGGTLTGTLTARAITTSAHDTYDIAATGTRFRTGYFRALDAATPDQSTPNLYVRNTHASADVLGAIRTTFDRGASSAYSHIVCYNDWTNTQDRVFNVRGDGNIFCDGSFSGGGADFAELMETKEESLPYGIALTVDRDGYVIAMTDESQPLLGIHRPKESVTVLGNNPIEWPQKWLRDEQGKILRNARGERRLNPAYRNPGPEFIERVRPGRDNVLERVMEKNPDYSPYIPRIDRPEWVAVGIAGLVAVRKDTFKKPSWVRIKELSAEVDLYKIGG